MRGRSEGGLIRFAKDVSGAVTIFAIVAFAMLIGLIGLILDVGRIMNMHSQANAYADRAALAAAAELDRTSDSLDRAVKAVNDADAASMIEKGNRFTLSGDSEVAVRRLTFISDLGPDPENPYSRSPVAGDVVVATWTPGGGFAWATGYDEAEANAAAQFVLVDVTQETEDYVLFPIVAFLVPGMDRSATVAPQAVAGFNRVICNNPPLMICNPAEATDGAGADFTPVTGQQILSKLQGNGAGWGPGIFGLLDVPNAQGAAAIREAMANRNPGTICISADVDVKPGQSTGPVQQGMNVRFDIYDGPMSGNRNNASYPPAANVVKGLKRQANGCPQTNASGGNNPDSRPLPRDTCFVNGTNCTNYGGQPRFGNGEWDRDAYWNTNHQPSGRVKPAGYPNMTRYQVYRWEIETPAQVSRANESGVPSCANPAQNPPSSSVVNDRRVLIIAIVNCVEHQAMLNGNARDLPTEAFARVFLTEPIGLTQWGASQDDIFIEMIDKVNANGPEGVLHEYPVLYR